MRKIEYEETRLNTRPGNDVLKAKSGHDEDPTYSGKEWNPISRREFSMTLCDCNTGFKPGIVLDPFMGAGTTALAALKHNRHFIGIEINPSYIELANERLKPYVGQAKIM